MPSNPKPIGKTDSKEHTSNKTAEKSNAAETKVQSASAAIKADGQKSPYHCEITCKQTKSWWEHVKPFVEVAGVVLLAVYTLYTIKMYCANKEAADAARSAAVTADKSLILTQQMFEASQAAVFTCQMTAQFEASRVFVECRDVGQISAKDVHGEAILTRGEKEPPQKRTISRNLVLKGDTFSAFYPIYVPAPGPTQFDWIARQHLKIEVAFTFNNGFDEKVQSYCGTLLVDAKQRSYSATDCEIAKELQEGQPQ